MRLPPRLIATAPLALALAACNGQPDTPEGRIAYERHENFERIGDAFKAITDELKKDSFDIAVIRNGAETINGFAPKVATWFPKGSGPEDGIRTDALQTIWTKPEQFQQAANRFVDEAARFKALTETGDRAALQKGAGDLGASCKNCHDTFREKD